MSLSPGQQISGYRVIDTIGCGGMGEVYRARDVRLERDVAIKILPLGWDDDHDHAARFEREARTLASLNHPNVAHIYGFEELDGRRFLILELVEGEELAERISRGPLSLDETAEFCRQIALALETAHELGVVHRDLKPANVKITPDSVVKVLDFGLAKSMRPLSGPESEVSAAREEAYQTRTGVLVGTPTYMSPERARGLPDDRRGDIWSFGCVLFECLTGKPPFQAETLPDMLVAIIEREPDLAQLPAGTPGAICGLIARCLDKDPRTRLRDIGEARIVLDGGYEEVPVAVGLSHPPPPRRSFRPIVIALAFLAGILAMLLLADPFAAVPPRNPLEGATITRLTNSDATEFAAAISQDGKFVAYAGNRDGAFDVWLHQVGTWNAENLTRGRKTFWAIRVRDIGFTPDGLRLWITALNSEDDRQPRSLNHRGEDLKDHFRSDVVNTDWSQVRNQVTYHTSHPGDPLFVAKPNDEADSQVEVLVHQPGYHQHYPTWSPKGEWIYLVRGLPGTREMELWRVRPEASGLSERLTEGMVEVMCPTPLSEKTVLFLAHEPNGAGPYLWWLDVESEERRPRRALFGNEQYTSLAGSADGRRLVATVADRRASVWRVPIPDADAGVATEAVVERVPGLVGVPAQGPRFGGEDLYFLSSRGAGDGLWRLREGRPTPILMSGTAALVAPPSISPNGEWLAVVLRRDGRVQLERMRPDGGDLKVLSDTVQVYGSPTWSPDGERIAVGGVDEQGAGLFIFPRDGGAPERLAEGFAINPIWSPTGERIVFGGMAKQAYHSLLSVGVEDGILVPIGDARVWSSGERYRFLPDGRRIVFMRGSGVKQDFWLLDLETLEERRLTELDDKAEMRSFDIDETGTHIVFDRIEENSDVVLIELRGESE